MAGQTQTQSMDLFDAYFRRADLDQDGRISGVEAVSFFQGANLPKQVLAQIWTYADQNRTSFLGRAEFYNALKLVTVAQSKRELTPDMVKAALYGPASAKIPAPKINLAATPAPQPNPMAGSPIPQLSVAAPIASQTAGPRGPYVAANTSTDQHLPSQQNQFMKPPRPIPLSTAFHPSQGMPGGSTMAASRPPSSTISADILGGRTGGPLGGVTSQVPNNSGFTPSVQPRPQATSGMAQPTSQKPQDSILPTNQVGPMDSKTLAVSGNGFASDSVFGDVFSASSSIPKQDSPVPALSTGRTQPTVGPAALGPLPSAFTQQPVSSQHQQVQPTVKQNQQVSVHGSTSFASTGLPAGSGNSASGQPQLPWPRMTPTDVQKYTKVFVEVDTDRDGKITGEQARNLFLSWRLPREVLKQVWDLSDQDNDSMLSLREFCVALYLMERNREGRPLPTVFPSNMVLDETLLPAGGQRAPAFGNANWGSPAVGVQRSRAMPGAQLVALPGRVSPSSQVSIPQADEDTQPSKQKPRVPLVEKHLVDQLSKEEQDALNSKSQEATEADKKVEELEKEILDSKEKIEFYRTKMQELILYKSRCDNRVNEITERVSADKREVESLAKKYEEKYKQSGDVASKLTIEEATFRDIQAKKMELYQEIVKMEQDGKADGFQTRADRIQLDLEELVKSLNERCKSYGLRAKPTALVELPFGWQSGIQGAAADWDEEWDKFEDEGFTFVKELTLDVQNVVAPPKQKSSSVRNKSSSTDEVVHAVSSPNANGKSESQPSPVKRVPEDESADARSEEGVPRSPPDSPAEKDALESPFKRFQDFQSRRSIGADFDESPRAAETQSDHGGAESVISGDKSFDETRWGAFDTHYDTDSVWDFNPATMKDIDHEKHGESSFFDSDNWGLNPIRTGPTHEDSIFQKNSAFAFDSVPSTPIINSGNSPHAENMFQKKSLFADSVPSTPMFTSGNSPRRFSGGSEENSFDSFSRFDSFGMPDSGNFPPLESLSRFDSMRSTRDSDYGQSFFPPSDSLARFDSFRSTADSEYNHGLFPPSNSLSRFDSIKSTRESDYGHGFPSFDETDPFGSSEPFKSSQESETPRRYSDNWRAF